MEGTVLIIDTDKDFCTSTMRSFADHDFEAVTIEDSEKGLSLLSKGKFDLAIIDMSIESFREKAAAITKSRNGTAIILISECYRHDIECLARGLTPAFYFVKPVDFADLYAVAVRISEIKSRRKMQALQRMKYREGVLHE
jgi:DNA-binding NtrC family response regulator